MKVYNGGPNSPCAQSRMARTAREHEALMARSMMSHMFRPTITDMQDKYCGDCYDIYPIQSQYTKVNIVAVTTILVLHVGNGRSEHV